MLPKVTPDMLHTLAGGKGSELIADTTTHTIDGVGFYVLGATATITATGPDLDGVTAKSFSGPYFYALPFDTIKLGAGSVLVQKGS